MSMPRPVFATQTSVPPEKTRAEIEKLVTKYGAKRFLSGWEDGTAAVMFEMHGKRVRFTLPLPMVDGSKIQKKLDQETRTRWRALHLVIKAKLEAVASGIFSFEQEFLSHIVLPTGATMGEHFIPQLDKILSGHKPPPLLPR